MAKITKAQQLVEKDIDMGKAIERLRRLCNSIQLSANTSYSICSVLGAKDVQAAEEAMDALRYIDLRSGMALKIIATLDSQLTEIMNDRIIDGEIKESEKQ